MSYDCWMIFAVFLMLISDLTQAIDQNDEDAVNEYDDQIDSGLPSNVITPSEDVLKYNYRSLREDRMDAKDEDYEPDVQLRDIFSKRSRLYRKYPGKRQNGGYVNDIYDCNPSSKETIRLLYAIHQARLGDIQHIVFCNRLRNPKGIIPNPRYIGKRSDSSLSYSYDDN